MKLKSLVTASDELPAGLTESYKSLKAVRAEVEVLRASGALGYGDEILRNDCC